MHSLPRNPGNLKVDVGGAKTGVRQKDLERIHKGPEVDKLEQQHQLISDRQRILKKTYFLGTCLYRIEALFPLASFAAARAAAMLSIGGCMPVSVERRPAGELMVLSIAVLLY